MTGLLFLLVGVFVLARIVQQVGEAGRRGGGAPVPREPGAAPTTMSELLQEMRGQLEIAQQRQAGRLPSPTSAKRPGTAVGVRPQRSVPGVMGVPVGQGVGPVDQDDSAEALVQRRIDEAEARNGAWQESDHRRFDAEIRVVPVAAHELKGFGGLRRAMIWREVLSPPLGLRDREEG
ncbi:MAG: hypothetical protein ABJC19_00485 [Gemmatimonadota bacterium]